MSKTIKTETKQNKIDIIPLKTPLKDKKEEENITSELDATSPIKDLVYSKKKKEYRAFLKLIKAGKLTTAVITSKVLGVSRQTISAWLKTTQAHKALNETASNYIKDIEASTDWKAKKYLLDKLEGTEEESKAIDLKQLIVINTS